VHLIELSEHITLYELHKKGEPHDDETTIKGTFLLAKISFSFITLHTCTYSLYVIHTFGVYIFEGISAKIKSTQPTEEYYNNNKSDSQKAAAANEKVNARRERAKPLEIFLIIKVKIVCM
jgi:hypothetical protein